MCTVTASLKVGAHRISRKLRHFREMRTMCPDLNLNWTVELHNIYKPAKGRIIVEPEINEGDHFVFGKAPSKEPDLVGLILDHMQVGMAFARTINRRRLGWISNADVHDLIDIGITGYPVDLLDNSPSLDDRS
jgi:hypothetical protein